MGTRIRLPVQYGIRELNCRGYTTDISQGSISIHTNRVFRPGTEIILRLDVDGVILTARGIVRWALQVPPQLAPYTRCGMDIEFTTLSERFRNFLQTFG